VNENPTHRYLQAGDRRKMTTIFKMANQESITPTFENMERSTIAPQNDGGPNMVPSLDEDGLSLEMERVEKCASSGQNYSYNSEWPVEQVSRLREYAEVVGFKGKMMPITASSEKQTIVEDDDLMKQLASIQANNVEASTNLRLAVGDPFLLADKNDVVKTKNNWEKVNPENRLASGPNQNARSGGITQFVENLSLRNSNSSESDLAKTALSAQTQLDYLLMNKITAQG
jgi:hypothetical protein